MFASEHFPETETNPATQETFIPGTKLSPEQQTACLGKVHGELERITRAIEKEAVETATEHSTIFRKRTEALEEAGVVGRNWNQFVD